MSFTGDLEHLPIADVIQLLNVTRKSGTLTIKSGKGESGLVFKDGYIVSANHLNDSVRVGKLLVEQNVIAEDVLAGVLSEQKKVGKNHKPLVAMLIEKGKIKKEDGFTCLETLIEMTIVEILTWGSGSFSFDMGNIVVSDEYRYFPENLHQEVLLDAQSALMDALRIYDEKKRDGQLEGDFWAGETAVEEGAAEEGEEAGGQEDRSEEEAIISAEDLGLDNLDQLERKIPSVFTGLDDVRPREIHRRKVAEAAPWLPAPEQEKLVEFLTDVAGDKEPAAPSGDGAQVVVLLSPDPLLSHTLSAVCSAAGVSVFATDEAQDLAPILDQYLAKATLPIFVLDRSDPSREGFSPEQIASLRRWRREDYPQVATIQLAPAGDGQYSLQTFADGVRTVFPRPFLGEGQEATVEDLIDFLSAFTLYLKASFQDRGQGAGRQLRASLSTLRQIKTPPKAAFILLRFVSGMFERAMTFVVGQNELIAERGIGVSAGKGEQPSAPLGFRVPLESSSIFRDVIEQGRPFFGKCEDAVLQDHMFKKIGAPQHSTILLLPMRSRGKTLSLTYGDFGSHEARPVPTDLLEMLADHAGLALENAAWRKKFEKADVQ